MSEKIPTNLIIGVVVAAAIGVGAYIWLGSSSPEPMDVQVTSGPAGLGGTAEPEQAFNTQEVLAQLNRLRQVNLSVEVFNTDTYLSLRDFGITISEQPIGRENPFTRPTFSSSGTTILPNPNPVTPQPLPDQEQEEATEADTDEDDQEEAGNESEPEESDEATESDTAPAERWVRR